jgi:hypothetical protein
VADKKGSYETGFGKPPRNKQFKKGQSGNPKGRPKHAKSSPALFNDELREISEFTDGKKRLKLRMRQIIAKQHVRKAATGDARSFKLVLEQDERYQRETEDNPLTQLLQSFREIYELDVKRLEQAAVIEKRDRDEPEKPES